MAHSPQHLFVSKPAALTLSPPPRICWLYTPGIVPYAQAWAWQHQFVRDRRQDPSLPDILILLEHPSVYTLGQGSRLDFLKFDPQQPSTALHRTERGGEVTYHCLGQIVGYPILNLRHYQTDLHWYLRQLEEVLIQVLLEFHIQGDRIPGLTGVWVKGYKVAALGIKVSRWITMHGFALNVCPDLSGFEHIVPCGIGDRPVGSLAQFLPQITLAEVQAAIAIHFAQVFQVELTHPPWQD